MGPCKSVKSFRDFVNACDFEQCKHIEIRVLATSGPENRQMLQEDNHFLISRSKYVAYGLLQCNVLIVYLETNGIFSPSKT